MAPSVTAMLIDDIHQSEASETVRFGVDGSAYEIELSARQASELRSMAGRYITAARRIQPAPSRARQQQPRPRTQMDREQRGGGHGLTDREKQELRTIADAARPGRPIVASRLRTKGLTDRDSAGNWWLTDAGRRELMSA